MGQDASSAPNITIGDFTLEVVEEFIGSTISTNLSLAKRPFLQIAAAGDTVKTGVQIGCDNERGAVGGKNRWQRAASAPLEP